MFNNSISYADSVPNGSQKRAENYFGGIFGGTLQKPFSQIGFNRGFSVIVWLMRVPSY